MKTLSLALGFASLIGVVAVSAASFVACTGDDPQVINGVLLDAGTDAESDTGVPAADAQGSDDASLTCAKPEQSCKNVCVNLLTSADNCNACNHSCGGGDCVQGACTPVAVRENIPGLNGFAVANGQMYFTSGTKVQSCAAGACTGVPTQLGDMVTYDALGIEIDSGFVYFESAPNQSTERPAIFRCAVGGCSNPPSAVMADGLNGIGGFKTFNKVLFGVLGGSGLQTSDCSTAACNGPALSIVKPVGAFAVDADRIYFQDQTGGGSILKSCPRTEVPCVNRTPVGSVPVQGDIVVAQNLVLFVGPGGSGGNGVFACPRTGGCVAPTNLVKLFSPITNLAADANGIYWTSDDKLMMCADALCQGGPITMLSGIVGMMRMRLDAKFVYFSVAGQTAKSGTIKRIAR